MILIPFDAGRLSNPLKGEQRTRTVFSVFALVANNGARRCLFGYEAETVGNVSTRGVHFLFMRVALVHSGSDWFWV